MSNPIPAPKRDSRQAGGIGIVVDDDGRDLQMFDDPVGEREILPARDLVGLLDASPLGVDRAAEADADGLDLRRGRAGLAEQDREGRADLLADAGRLPGRIDAESFQGDDVAPAATDAELELGPADLDPQRPRRRRPCDQLAPARRGRGPWRRSAGTGRR